jgi:hypothetical protein
LLAFWLPVTVHCCLGTLEGLGFLACCEHSTDAPHQDNDCEQDACTTIESGHFLAPETGDLVSAPADAAAFGPDRTPDYRPPQRDGLEPPCPAPPEPARPWPFRLRAAAAPRAPGAAS